MKITLMLPPGSNNNQILFKVMYCLPQLQQHYNDIYRNRNAVQMLDSYSFTTGFENSQALLQAYTKSSNLRH